MVDRNAGLPAHICHPIWLGRIGFGGTLLACAIKDDFVVFHAKLRRRHPDNSLKALLKLKNLTAFATKKVVMMAFVSALVSRGLPRNFKRYTVAIPIEGTACKASS